MEWSQEKILFFIEQYRSKPILWDPQDPQHYNKLKKHDAWQQLANELETTEDECRRKITSLLASLRRKKGKVCKSRSTGKGTEEVYNSNWFAFKALAFVLDRNKPRSTRDTIETITEMEGNAVEDTGGVNRNETDETAETAEPTRNEIASNNDESRPPRAKKTKKSMQSPEEMMASAYNVLKHATQKRETTTRASDIDECESFGLFITNKLKNYSRVTRNTVQHHMSNILFNADQGRYDIMSRMDARYEYGYGQPDTLRPHSSVSTHSPTPSPHSSLQSLGGGEGSHSGYLPGTQARSGYQGTSAQYEPPLQLDRSLVTARPPHPHSLASLLSPTRSLQGEHTQGDHTQESKGFIDEFSDLIN